MPVDTFSWTWPGGVIKPVPPVVCPIHVRHHDGVMCSGRMICPAHSLTTCFKLAMYACASWQCTTVLRGTRYTEVCSNAGCFAAGCHECPATVWQVTSDTCQPATSSHRWPPQLPQGRPLTDSVCLEPPLTHLAHLQHPYRWRAGLALDSSMASSVRTCSDTGAWHAHFCSCSALQIAPSWPLQLQLQGLSSLSWHQDACAVFWQPQPAQLQYQKGCGLLNSPCWMHTLTAVVASALVCQSNGALRQVSRKGRM